MNYHEEQIKSFEKNGIGVPPYLAVLALTERFAQGWDSDSLAGLTLSEIKETPDWTDLERSPAWDYCPNKDLLIQDIQQHLKTGLE